ncbi:TPA: hypothetical protein HA219_03795 [Candidatus Woesearchaeota archaeon]|nr:hypothetical protein [uncultured archaeon]MBS3115832.1 hypothetical protein [Candidatus Woesearchaeota archaeon]HIH39814.1 hypothetical protein [Candidatus Woesearchaeota archaeon]
MKRCVEDIIMDIPVFYDQTPKEKIAEEILRRDGETVLLSDKTNFSKSYFLCRLRIDPKDKEHYFVQLPLGNSEKAKAFELKLKYENLIGLKVKTEHGPMLASKKYKIMLKS